MTDTDPTIAPRSLAPKLPDFVERARDTMTVKRVFGDPIERDGTTVIPAASVFGGIGTGSGIEADGKEGAGGGMGVRARPLGAVVIRDGEVSWEPADDPTRRALATAAVAIIGILAARSVLNHALRRRHGRHRRH
jgi:uncharacterized spore protein YtfJ